MSEYHISTGSFESKNIMVKDHETKMCCNLYFTIILMPTRHLIEYTVGYCLIDMENM